MTITKRKAAETVKQYGLITASVFLIIAGSHFFKFPNNFTFGGVTGLSVVVGKIGLMPPSTANFILNMVLLVLGFFFLGRKFAVKTVYASILLSVGLSVMDKLWPLTQPLTNEPMLELAFAIALPGLGSALLFNIGASGGGTDIIAMILKKHTSINIGMALMLSDFLITITAIFIFDIKTLLFSLLGMLTKSLVIDNVIESINLCKYFNIVCEKPEPICAFITEKLKRSATLFEAEGAFSHNKKYVVLTVLRRPQALVLRQFVKETEPDAFIMITNTSEIIGKGFHGE